VAWGLEDKSPGGRRLCSPAHDEERRLLRFLELSRVGRIVGDGADEEERRATPLDGWIAWEAEERVVEDF